MLLLVFIFFVLRINYDLEEVRCPADKRRRMKDHTTYTKTFVVRSS